MKAPERAHEVPAGVRIDGPRPRDGRPRRHARGIPAVAAVAVVAALIGAGGVYAWHRSTASDADRSLAQVIAERDEARAEAASLTARLERSTARLDDRSARVAELERAVGETDARFTAMLGPALFDGRHVGYLYAVGATQDPPRLTIDLSQWFTDEEAREAALEDGVPPADAGINGYYIRNEDPRWRTIEVDPAAEVGLVTYPLVTPDAPHPVGLDRFGELFRSFEGRLLQYSPFWITIEDGVIVAIEEQYLP